MLPFSARRAALYLEREKCPLLIITRQKRPMLQARIQNLRRAPLWFDMFFAPGVLHSEKRGRRHARCDLCGYSVFCQCPHRIFSAAGRGAAGRAHRRRLAHLSGGGRRGPFFAAAAFADVYKRQLMHWSRPRKNVLRLSGRARKNWPLRGRRPTVWCRTCRTQPTA